jgi:hypothetical protein
MIRSWTRWTRCINELESQESEKEPAKYFYRAPKPHIAVSSHTALFTGHQMLPCSHRTWRSERTIHCVLPRVLAIWREPLVPNGRLRYSASDATLDMTLRNVWCVPERSQSRPSHIGCVTHQTWHNLWRIIFQDRDCPNHIGHVRCTYVQCLHQRPMSLW